MTYPFYLHGLLRCCGTPTWSVTRSGNRRYRCATCGHGIDALTAEVEVWELAWQRKPDLGNGRTPYEQRGVLLAGVLDHVNIVTTGAAYQFDLSFRSPLKVTRR